MRLTISTVSRSLSWNFWTGALAIGRGPNGNDGSENVNTAIGRLIFVSLFSYLVGKTGNLAYIVVLTVLGLGELWTLIALAFELREWIAATGQIVTKKARFSSETGF